MIPKPLDHRALDGDLVLVPGTPIEAPAELAGVASVLAELLLAVTGAVSPVSENPSTIRLALSAHDDLPGAGTPGEDEAHVVEIAPHGVTLLGRSPLGVFRAVQALRRLLPTGAEQGLLQHIPVRLPGCRITDAPRFGYRGVMLDVARSFLTVDEVTRFVDSLVPFGLTHLHLHLADDQGWRIEILGTDADPDDPIDYTQLTAVSGATAMTEQGYRDEPGRTGYYTQEDLRRIVEHCRGCFVTVVPEIDVPSHTNAALAAIPQLNTPRSLPPLADRQDTAAPNGSGEVGYSALDEELPLTYVFIRQVFRELAAVTGSPLVHLGGDESHEMGHERYVAFVRRVLPELREVLPPGTSTMGWTEYAEAGLGQHDRYWDGCVVQYWHGEAGWVRDFADRAGRVVVSPGRHAYVDMKYDPSTPIGLTWAGDHNPLENFYDWDPLTAVDGGLPEVAVLGVEACLWSETVRGVEQAWYLTLPRALAVLEVGWSGPERDVDDFRGRLASWAPRFALQGMAFHASPGVPWESALVGLSASVGADEAVVARLAGVIEVGGVTGRLATASRTTDVTVRTLRSAHELDDGSDHALVVSGLAAEDVGPATLTLIDGRSCTVTLTA